MWVRSLSPLIYTVCVQSIISALDEEKKLVSKCHHRYYFYKLFGPLSPPHLYISLVFVITFEGVLFWSFGEC